MTEPLMMTLRQFAELHAISVETARRCIEGASTKYPPLKAKKSGGVRPRIYITADAAKEWREQLQDA